MSRTIEEDFAELVPNEDPFFEVTRYGLGARGVDWIEKATVEDTSISFPIYDGHGNVIAQLGRTGSSYSLTQVKSYDVWGGVRSGALGPAGRYCGNLGHVSDDESGLIYMRARYYEPGSGRFISQDPAMDGQNWFAYCGNDPVNLVDESGQEAKDVIDGMKKFYELLKTVGVNLPAYGQVAAVAVIITKLYLELVKLAGYASWGANLGNLGAGLSVCNTFIGGGTLVLGYSIAGIATILAFFEIYNSCLAVYILVDDLAADGWSS